LEIKAVCEKAGDGWAIDIPDLDNLHTNVKRLDKAVDNIKLLAKERFGVEICDVVVKIEAKMPSLVRDLEQAQAKMREANRLQEEASAAIRAVVGHMRNEGLTMRDIGVLLGVSPQRVAQLASCPTSDIDA
jgi:DNA-directed RNA polymerase sigma subunit (sigma70/sigma32)